MRLIVLGLVIFFALGEYFLNLALNFTENLTFTRSIQY